MITSSVFKKIYHPLTLISIAFCCLGTECHKYNNYVFSYHFVDKVDLFPAQKYYQIGDTIWVSFVKPSKLLFDQTTKANILVDTASVTVQFGIFTTSFYAPNYPVAGLIDYVTISDGQVNKYPNYDQGLFVTFGCNTGNTYDFKIGIVLKQKGIFMIDFNALPRPVAACSNRTQNFPPADIYFTYNLEDCNKDLYNALPQSIKDAFSGTDIDNKQGFLFYVQ